MKLHETRHIARPVPEVFRFTADFANIENWDPGVKSSEKIGDGPVGLGTRYDLVTLVGSSEVPMVYEITAFEPDRRVVLVGTGKTFGAVDEIVFESEDGGTFVDYTADLTFDGWLRFLAPVMAPFMRRVGRRALDGLVDFFVE
jgi:carbon monoxide dehydrogenase subunit G